MAQEYLELARTLVAPAEAAWRALTDPDALRGWWGPPGGRCTDARMELRRGGAFRLVGEAADGERLAATGEVLWVDEGQELHLAWRWQGAGPASEVMLGLEDLGDRCRLHLRQEGLPDEEAVDEHALAWMHSLDSLAAFLRCPDDGGAIVRKVHIAAPPEVVAHAIARVAGLAAWWSTEVEAGPESDQTDPEDEAMVGDVLRLEIDADGALLWLRVEAEIEDRVLAWCCEGEDPDWADSVIRWSLEAQGEGTDLLLVHDGVRDAASRTAAAALWTELLQRLRAHCETGGSDPYFSA